MALIDLSAVEIVRKIKQKEISAVQVLDSALIRISEVDGEAGSLDHGALTEEDKQKVHAFINITEEQARLQAEEVDRKIAAGIDPGPLAGVPITIKDIFCVKDTLTTAASKILANFKAPYTATS
ncbi:MAG: amidase family protein, partial [Anaerolineaceae bacterium]|nr:amidase family protein [Anaerolineaceae bacterium]